MQPERDVAERARDRRGQRVDLEQHLARRHVAARIAVGQLAADHRVMTWPMVRTASAGADRPPVAHDRDLVGDGHDLFELVRDVDDRDALGAQVRDEPEEALDLVLRERRGGLVHDHHASVERDRASDLHELDLGDREVARLRVGVELDADLLEQPPAVAAHPVVIHEPEATRGKRPSQMFSMTLRAGTGWSSCWIIEMPARIASAGLAKRTGSPPRPSRRHRAGPGPRARS